MQLRAFGSNRTPHREGRKGVGLLKEYRRILKAHSDEVYGVSAKTTLSFYTILSIACIVVPVVFLLTLLVLKLF